MPTLTPYLNFDGRCREAMHFYERALGARLLGLMTQAESPLAADIAARREATGASSDTAAPGADAAAAGACAVATTGDADPVLHACLELPGGAQLYGGDCGPEGPTGIHGVSLTLQYDTVDDAHGAFAALADGGRVTVPMQPAFWARTWGMLIDRFGVPWIVNGEPLEP